MESFEIKSKGLHRRIGPEQPAFIIAEMSGNHMQNYDKAIEIIDAAAEAGVDAIKIQTYTPDTITLDCDSEFFQVSVNEAWKGQSLYSLYKKVYTPWEWQPKLKEYAESKGLFLFSSPFDNTAVDFLEKMDVPIYKVASYEVGHIPLLKKIGKTKKPVIMSRGLATVEEIELAIKTLKDSGCPNIVVLHCIAAYPAMPKDMNLKAIPEISKRFNVISGISDHSLSQTVATVSVALGAKVVEKHLTILREEKGPDSAFSIEPAEFKELVQNVRETETLLGEAEIKPGKAEKPCTIFRPSVWVTKDIKKGETLTEENIIVRRPNNGLAPKHFEEVLGKKAAKDIKKCTPLSLELVEK